MKGVSAVIAIILILMIVVALAALAYTWFTGIFSDFFKVGGESIGNTVESVTALVSIDNVKCDSNVATITITNSGAQDIDLDSMAIYVDDVLVDHDFTGSLSPNNRATNKTAAVVDCSSARTVRVSTIEGAIALRQII